jgi:hypothetical protein
LLGRKDGLHRRQFGRLALACRRHRAESYDPVRRPLGRNASARRFDVQRPANGQNVTRRRVEPAALPLGGQASWWLVQWLVRQLEGAPVHGHEIARAEIDEGLRCLLGAGSYAPIGNIAASIGPERRPISEKPSKYAVSPE